MPPAKKRKTAAKAKGAKKNHVVTATASSPPQQAEHVSQEPPTTTEAPAPTSAPEQEPATATPSASQHPPAEASKPSSSSLSSSPTTTTVAAAAATTINDRLAKFRALQSRAKTSSTANLTAAQTEAHRLAHDPSQLATIQRQSAIANQKLQKADIEDGGGDFERKRAWDWTVDESEKWDERLATRAAHRDNNAFQDFRAEANKVYERQVRNLGEPDLERYLAQKTKAIEEAAARGTLEIVETEEGEMVAVDRDGTFYGGGGGRDLISSFVDNKPDKKALDRLVGEMKKAEEVAAKKRRERLARNGDDGDVTYINDKNSKLHPLLTVYRVWNSADGYRRAIQPEAGALLQQVHGGDQGQLRARHDDLRRSAGVSGGEPDMSHVPTTRSGFWKIAPRAMQTFEIDTREKSCFLNRKMVVLLYLSRMFQVLPANYNSQGRLDMTFSG